MSGEQRCRCMAQSSSGSKTPVLLHRSQRLQSNPSRTEFKANTWILAAHCCCLMHAAIPMTCSPSSTLLLPTTAERGPPAAPQTKGNGFINRPRESSARRPPLPLLFQHEFITAPGWAQASLPGLAALLPLALWRTPAAPAPTDGIRNAEPRVPSIKPLASM